MAGLSIRPDMAKTGYSVLAKLVDPILDIEGTPDLIHHIGLNDLRGHKHRQAPDVGHLEARDGGSHGEAAQRCLPNVRG